MGLREEGRANGEGGEKKATPLWCEAALHIYDLSIPYEISHVSPARRSFSRSPGPRFWVTSVICWWSKSS